MPDHSPQRQEATEPAGPLESQTDNLPEKRKGKHPGGRPTQYTHELGVEICRRLAKGETLRRICQTPEMPHADTVREWALGFVQSVKEFPEMYARAKELQAHALIDEIPDIADDATGDIVIDADGKEHVNHENIQRSRLRVDTRKWVASKTLPKIYGDKIQMEGGQAQNITILGLAHDAAIDYLRRRGKIYLPEDRKALIQAPVEAIEVEAVEADEKQPETK